MTREQAEAIVKRHQNEKYYYVSPLQCNTLEVLDAYEDGFTFRRTTEYIECFGVYEQYDDTNDIFDHSAYSISEVIVKRFK